MPTAPPPESPVTETLEQIANRICRHYLDSERVSVTQFCDIEAAIAQALRNERERCAKVAETVHDDKVFDVDLILRNEIAKAIREGK